MRIVIKASDLSKVYKACKHAVSKDDSVASAYTQVRLDSKGGMCEATALDGYRIRVVRVPCSGDDGIMLVPVTDIPKRTAVVAIEDTGKEIVFSFGDVTQVVGKIEGAFPNPDRFIPTHEAAFSISFNSRYLKEAFDSFGGEMISLNFFGEQSPCVIKGGDGLALVLPLRKN